MTGRRGEGGGGGVDAEGEVGLRRSSRVTRRTRRLGESQDYLDDPDVRDAAGLPPLVAGDVEREGGRERLAVVVLHRQGGDVWAPGPAAEQPSTAELWCNPPLAGQPRLGIL